MISEKGYQPLDTDGKAYIRHGRDGLPAVWSRVGVEECSSGPEAGSREGCGMLSRKKPSRTMLLYALSNQAVGRSSSDVLERATWEIVWNGKARGR